MVKKRLSLADRIAQSNAANTPDDERQKEQSIISIVTSDSSTEIKPDFDLKKDTPETKVRSRSGQGQVDTVLTQGQPNSDNGSGQGQDSVRTISGQDQVSSIRSGSGQGQVSSIRSGSSIDPLVKIKSSVVIKSEECVLAPKQQQIYTWFLKNGISGYFNKGVIQRDTGINHPTVRKCIVKLISLNLLQISEYDPVSRQQKYQINTDKNVHILKGSGQGQVSSIRSVSGQGQVSDIRSGSGQGQVDTDFSSNNKLVSKFKKLTNYIEISNFWNSQGISEKKCKEWIDEFYPDDPEALMTQLMFAGYAEEHNSALQPKNKNKTPVDVFYGCLKKGGMTRPAGFEFPEERAARIRKEELEAQKKILAEQAAIREQEKTMADELAFNEFLKDADSVGQMIDEMENKKRFITPKQKISMKLFREKGQIDSRLENSLRIEFNRDDE